jgi:WD40 repeat protein
MPRALLTFALASAAFAQGSAPNYARDVYPIFQKACLNCHASGVRMGTLDLETWDGMNKGGNSGPIYVKGKSAESTLYLTTAGKWRQIMPMDGKMLPAGDVETIRRWIDAGAPAPTAAEMQTAQQADASAAAAKPSPAAKKQIFSLAWSPDGKRIAVGGYQSIRLIDPSTKTDLATLSGHIENVRAVAWSPDSKLLVAAGGQPGRKGEAKVWSAEGTLLATINGHNDAIFAAVISPDGKTIATASYDKMIWLWDASTGKEIRRLKDHIDSINAISFTPDGRRLVSGAADRTVKIWDVASGERLYTFGEPLDGINTIAISPDGRFVAAAGLDKNIRIWQMGEKGGSLKQALIAHEDAILRMAWSPDGRHLVSASADRTIKVFRVEDLTELRSIDKQSDWVNGLAFAPDGQSFAAGRFDGSLTIYPLPPSDSKVAQR